MANAPHGVSAEQLAGQRRQRGILRVYSRELRELRRASIINKAPAKRTYRPLTAKLVDIATLSDPLIIRQIDKAFALRISQSAPRRESHRKDSIGWSIWRDVCIVAEMTGFVVQTGFSGLGGSGF